ncbi:MAG: urease subunit beta [Gaiellaceae bacterium]
MRPGELVPGPGPAPQATPAKAARVTMRNSGKFPIYLGSHFDLVRASALLEFDRASVDGARLGLPAGATARIAAGETVELDVVWD